MNDNNQITKVNWFIEIVYFVIACIFNFKLWHLNKALNALKDPNPLKILAYDNNAALKYFFGAFLLILFGILLTWWFFHVKDSQFDGSVLLFCVSLIVNIIIVVVTIVFIQNPILRAVLVVGFLALGTTAGISEN